MDAKSRSLLEKDPGNPNLDSNSANPGRPRSGLSNNGGHQSTSAGRPPTLKEAIAAQKKARLAASRNMPSRPESAQSSFSEAKSSKSTPHRTAGSSASATRSVPTGAPISSQKTSLSSAPMRPGSRPRRPEIARPATADPYARRNTHESRSKTSSPSQSPQKPRTKSITTPSARSHTPARPKSRIEAPSVGTAKTKPKRLDITSIKSGDGRPTAASTVKTTSASTPEPVTLPNESPINVEELSVAMPHIDDGNQAPQITSGPSTEELPTVGPNQQGAPEAMSITSSPRPVKTEHQGSPRHQRLSSDGSAPRIPLSPSFKGQPNLIPLSDHNTPRRHTENAAMDLASPVQGATGHQSPLNNENVHQLPPLKVYEDPQSPGSHNNDIQGANGSPKTPHFDIKTTALEELPLNEPASMPNRKNNEQIEPSGFSPVSVPLSGENLHRRWKKVEGAERRRSLSPRSKDLNKAREMISKGLNKIRTGAIDVHGYRKFQGLLKYHESIIQDESKYFEVLAVLLDALEAPDAEKRIGSGKSLDLKTQVLVTVRLMFFLNRTYFSTYYARAMTAIISARRLYEVTNHIVSGLEDTAEDIVAVCNPFEVLEATLDLLEREEESAEGQRMLAMGTYILSGLLHRLNEKHVSLGQPGFQRVGKFVNRNLRDPQPDIRRATIDFCVELHEMVKPEEDFWQMINSPIEDFRPLLTYYIVRKPNRL